MGKKEFYKETVEIYKPIYDAVKEVKRRQKAKGTYDLVTIIDRETGKEININIGINLMDKLLRNGRKNMHKAIMKKILYG